ncbi:hypothetical protein TI04_06295 [Achromatium sp. WMS2]|nr:hypothetical protein TI04_06295 [Achromatium sp. WMS2]
MTTPKEGVELVNELTAKGYEAAKALGEINMRLMERMLTRQMDAMNLFVNGGLQNLKLLTEAKNPGDLMRSQMDLVRTFSNSLLAETRETLKIADDGREQYKTWFEQGMQELNEKMGKQRPSA